MDLSNLLSGVEAQEEQSDVKKALPDGNYNVKIEKVEGKKNETTGSAGVSMQMRVYGEKYNNYCLFDYMLIKGSEAGLKYSLPKLKKLGTLCASENTDAWVGKTVNVRLSVDKNDNTKNIIWGYQEAQAVDNTPIVNNTTTSITASDLPF